MGDKKTCPDCGAALTVDAPDGFCPGCLMGAGVSASVAGKEENAQRFAEAGPGLGAGVDRDELGILPCDFGEYELLEEIARGGMGVVYKARQKSLDRLVAVKMLLAGQFATKQFVQRFRTEAAAAAVLRHPNIVPIYQVGFQSGQHFFSMEYVEGQNLAQLVGQRPLPSTKAAAYLKAIAEAIHYAHQQGILHRDLKPSNVLIDSATDQPRVTDFGLARRLDGESSLTVTGQVLGSPNFMPPEQAGGRHKVLGRHSDVYGLGAILYHLITARAPFQAPSLEATVMQVVNADPVSPRLLNPAVRPDLETICLKCLEKEPSRRYQSAEELARELERFLNGEPILARPVSRPERVWRWCRRKPALATLGAIAMALLMVVVVGAPIAIARIQQARAEAERNLYAADMKLVSEAVKQGAYDNARELLDRHGSGKDRKDLRGFEWRYFWKFLEDQKPVRSLEGLPAKTGWEDVSLCVRGDILYNQAETELRAWDINTWEPVPVIKPPQAEGIKWMWYVTSDRACAVDNANATVTIYHLPGFDNALPLHMPGPVSETALKGDLLATAVQSEGKWQVLVWDLRTGIQIGSPTEYASAISRLVFSPDKTLLGVSCRNGTVGIWDLATFAARPTPPKGANGSPELQFFPDSRRLLVGGDDAHPCRVWDIQAESQFELAPAGIRQLSSFGFSPDGKFLVTRPNWTDLTLLDAASLQPIGTLHGHLGLTRGMGYSPDGKLLATASVDQTVRIWELATLQPVAVLGGFGERISDVKFSPDGRTIILISGFGALKAYDRSKVVNRGLFATVPDPGGIISMALSPDRHTLATRSLNGTVTIRDRASRTQLWSEHFDDGGDLSRISYSTTGNILAWNTHNALKLLNVNSGAMTAIRLNANPGEIIRPVAFSPDGVELAYSCRTQLLVLDLKSQNSRVFAPPTDDEVFAIDYSPDGKCLVFGDRLGSLTMCERFSGQILFKTNAHRPHCATVQFSPDGRLLASAGHDALIKLWTVHPKSLALRKVLRGHRGYVRFSFSPDGSRLVSGASDQMIKLWDVEQGVELATLYGHSDYVSYQRFAEDGNTLYSTGWMGDRQIRYWEAPALDQIDAKFRPASAPK